MPNYEQLSTGMKIEALSQKVTQLQKDMTQLRQEVRAVSILLQRISDKLETPKTDLEHQD